MAFSLQGNSFATSDVKTLPVGAARLQRRGRHLLRLGGRLQTFDLLGGVCPLHRGDHILTATKPNDTSRSQIPSDSILRAFWSSRRCSTAVMIFARAATRA